MGLSSNYYFLGREIFSSVVVQTDSNSLHLFPPMFHIKPFAILMPKPFHLFFIAQNHIQPSANAGIISKPFFRISKDFTIIQVIRNNGVCNFIASFEHQQLLVKGRGNPVH